MKRAIATLFILLISLSPLQAGHFFLPQRNLFYIRPDLYVYGTPFFRHPRIYPRPCPATVYYGPTLPYFSKSRSRGVYQLVINSPAGMEIVRANTADLIFQVSPSRALIYIDEKLIGNARDFSTERDRYMLIEGEHSLRIEFPGYKPFRTDMNIVSNRTLQLDIELEELPSNP